MLPLFQKSYLSPLGYLTLISTEDKLKKIQFSDSMELTSSHIPPILDETKNQLEEYFMGQRFVFSIQMDPDGSDFQKKVWEQVFKVPFGETSTYKEIALKLGGQTYIRAIGKANGMNPVPIIIPCHRIIGSNGKLVGYAGGIDRKKQLLLHELKYSGKGILF